MKRLAIFFGPINNTFNLIQALMQLLIKQFLHEFIVLVRYWVVESSRWDAWHLLYQILKLIGLNRIMVINITVQRIKRPDIRTQLLVKLLQLLDEAFFNSFCSKRL